MGRWGYCLILLVGCTPPAGQMFHDQAALAAALALAVAGDVSPAPTPGPPTPAPSNVCPECNNQGWVGDSVVKLPCPNPSCPVKKSEPPPEYQAAATDILDLALQEWNWQGIGDPPTSFKRQHLIQEHGMEPAAVNKMTGQELQAAHNLLHDSAVRQSAPADSCPSGNCPTSAGSTTSYRRGLFGRRR